MDVESLIEPPPGAAADTKLIAARVEGDGMHPLRAGWTIYFEEAPCDPSRVVGKLAVVRVDGRAQMMIREVRKGSSPGLYTLLSWSGAPLEDVEVESAHLIVSFAQPT